MVYKKKYFRLNPYIFLIILLIFTNHSFAQVKETNYFCSKEFVENYSLDEFRAKILSGINVNEKCKYSELPALFMIFNVIKDPEALDLLEKTNADFDYIEENLEYSKGRNLLFDAVRGYLTESIPFLISKGVNINKEDSMGNTPLLRACLSSKNNNMIDELIENGANINDLNLKGETCLSNGLSFNRNHDQIKKIFKKIQIKERKNCKQGSSPKNLKNITCPTLLMKYLSRGFAAEIDVSFVEFLIENGSNPNEYSNDDYSYTIDGRQTPLIKVLSHRYLDIDHKIKLTKSLIRLGANPNLGRENKNYNGKIKFGHTPIFYAIKIENVKNFNKQKELLEILIRSGAQLNTQVNYGFTRVPLWETLSIKPFSRFKEMTTFLWANGADINKRNAGGKTLIFDVVGRKNELDMFKHLYKLGAKINLANREGLYLAHRVAQKSFSPNLIDFLISKGIDFKIKGVKNFTPLMLASLSNYNFDVVRKIIDVGANVNAQTSYQQTSLMFALRENKNPLIAQELINRGANVNTRTADGLSPIMFAAFNDNFGYNKKEKKISVQLVQMLLNAGANINNVSNDGSIALHTAVSTNITPYLTLFLIENGADYKHKNLKGETALDLIKKNPHLKDSEAYWKLHQLNLQ